MHEQITDRIYIIKVSLPKNPLRSLNSYIVTGPERNLLIDTGFNLSESFTDLSAGIKSLKLDMTRTDIFLTHCHSDHTGLAGRIAAPSSRIFISSIDKPLAERMVGGNNASKERLIFRLIEAGYPKDEVGQAVDINPALANNASELYEMLPVEEGAEFDLGGFTLTTVHTPGHSPGHMCLYNKDEKTLFAGDHVLFDITPNITHWPEMYDSLGAYIDSLKKISEFDVALTLPAHRKPGDIKLRIDELLLHHKRRLAEVLSIIMAGPGQNICEIASKMTWSIRNTDWVDFPMSQKSFAIGEARSHLHHLELQNSIRSEKIGETLHFYV